MLSDNQRRTICRITFLVGCLAPTFGVLYTIFHRPTISDWARNIKAELGVEARIVSLETPLPGITILRGVKLFDPEVGTLFEATEVAVEITREMNRIEVDQHLSLSKNGLAKLIELINENPLRRHGLDRPWQIHFNGLATIHDAGHELRSGSLQLTPTLTIENTQIRMQPLQDGSELQFRFQIAGEPTVLAPGHVMLPQPIVKGYLARNHAWEAGYSELIAGLDTQGAELPCWLVGDTIPELKQLGSQARFQGSFELASRNNLPEIKVQGRFRDLDRSRFYQGGAFDSLDLICEYDGDFKTWDANLVDRDFRIPLPRIDLGQPRSIERAIREAQQRPLQVDNSIYR